MSSNDVAGQIILSPQRLEQFVALTEDAIQAAIQAAMTRIRQVAMAETPAWTGRLKSSFDIASTPRSIVFKWSATSDKGYSYAKVVDEGRTGGTVLTPKVAEYMAFPVPWKYGELVFRKRVEQGGFEGRNYKERVKQQAIEILKEELMTQLLLLGD